MTTSVRRNVGTCAYVYVCVCVCVCVLSREREREGEREREREEERERERREREEGEREIARLHTNTPSRVATARHTKPLSLSSSLFPSTVRRRRRHLCAKFS